MDARERLLATNEPKGAPAPRVFVARAGAARIVRVRSDIADPVARRWIEADDADLRALVEAHAPVLAEHRGPAFVLPPLARTDVDVVAIGPTTVLDSELAARGWTTEETPPYLGVVQGGIMVSVCYSARSTADAAEAGVETAISWRNHGLATRAVSAWAAAVQASDRLALYSTTWDNEASLRLATRLGAIEYGEDWHLS
jgi:hypothetical protein